MSSKVFGRVRSPACCETDAGERIRLWSQPIQVRLWHLVRSRFPQIFRWRSASEERVRRHCQTGSLFSYSPPTYEISKVFLLHVDQRALMAKKSADANKPNKSEAIRQVLAQNPDAKPTQVATLVNEQFGYTSMLNT